MPDPALYLQAALAAMTASLLAVMVFRRLVSMRSPDWTGAVGTAGLAVGLLAGYAVWGVRCRWPVNGLDRLLLVILPAAVVTQTVTVQWPRGLLAALPRLVLALLATPVLLYDSVHLAAGPSGGLRVAAILFICPVMMLALWWPMDALATRSREPVSLLVCLALAVLTAGIAILLAGYVKGGGASVPLGMALLGVAIALSIGASEGAVAPVSGAGVLGLAGLVGVGFFFGELALWQAMVLLIAPLTGWVTELPGLRTRPAWQLAVIRIILVLVPLAGVVTEARSRFERDMRPLLGMRAEAPCVASKAWTPC